MLKELLEKHNIMLAVAESLTGGQLSSKICEEEGISKHYLGSVTAYNNEVKHNVLGVDAKLLETEGPYNTETVNQMCDGVINLLGPKNAIIAISTSGVAGPGPDRGTPAGKFYVAIAVRRYYGIVQRAGFEYQIYNCGREKVREIATQMAYNYLVQYLIDNKTN